ncbi:MAG: CAP domain-containing protein, partial [Mycobacterium sp.]
MRQHVSRAAVLLAVPASGLIAMPSACADNARLNNGVVANVYTVRYQSGCIPGIAWNQALTAAARQHAL